MNLARLTLRGLCKSKATRFCDEVGRLRGHTNLTTEWLYNRVKKLLLPGNYIACETCGTAMCWESATIDHKVPRTAHQHYKGNIHGVENLQLVCPTCNSLKGQKSLEEFLKELEEWNEKIIELRRASPSKEIYAPLFPQVGLGIQVFSQDVPRRDIPNKRDRRRRKSKKARIS